MKIILSAAISLDGYLDDCSPTRLRLSSPEDWNEVQKLRGNCDAILVGAATIRKDNPSLIIKDETIRNVRKAKGMNPDIVKVTLSSSGNIDPASNFFAKGEGPKIVFLSEAADDSQLSRLKNVEIIKARKITASLISDSLAERGYKSLMVEGGGHVHTMFLTEGIVDELRLAVAPFFVGDENAPRFVYGGDYRWDSNNMMKLEKVETLGYMSVLHFKKNMNDKENLQLAINESRKCKPVMTSYCVGAVIITTEGQIFKGYTHESDNTNHAEEEAITKAKAAGAVLEGATIYSSMEPCSSRASKPCSCSQLIIKEGFAKVVYALKEPPHFVKCFGNDILKEHGIEVVHIPELGWEVESINGHIK